MRGRAAAGLMVLLLAAGAAQAFEVEISAPDDLKPLLERHLEAARAARLGEVVDTEEIQRLDRLSLETARELLATEGYFSPQLASSLAGETLRYTVTAGPRTRVRSVTIHYAGTLAQDNDGAWLRARIERGFRLPAGMPFRQADWEAAKTAALLPLLSGRYLAARIEASEARIDPVAQSADLSLVLDSGPAFFYGAPEIVGAKRYPASIARHLNPAKPGKPVNQQDLLDYQAALESSGYYSQALVRIDPDPAQAAAALIRVEVVERPEKLLSLGAGFSTDTGARVQASWLARDIADRGLRLKLDGKIETRSQSTAAELTWPQNAKGYSNSVGAQFKREDIEGQETRSTLMAAKRSRTRGQIETTLALQYQTETQQVGSTVSARNQALTANYAWTQRAVGRAFYPREGYVFTAQVSGAAAALFSDTSFLRLYGRHTHHVRLGRSDRLVLRGEAGVVLADTRDGIPTDFLFRAGGDNSVRGYAYQSLGRTLEGGVASVRTLVTGSVEYNHFFTRDWGMALFVDAGDAADTPGSLSPVFGVGAGARYRSPVGPVNLDLAYGEATDEFRLHFSLGVSF
ncbi:MAG: outer membrane protein assembly factor [Hydrogenophilales bacterium 16-64-46]|nr:MAG: outer membrane protein assembly factor [Hydrogenophilales bacterium 12-64-13]OYZ05643.1 MAG: outer membrane protein assembly factor [Hydrogenophilales bacterium 16-64-46]OZA40222.1 MAG: outer membrane protein assembly factor [Hydrogenophilales bacterium 17-64-34]HQT00772.1 autotransporter assembly complex family protein [Thiobacillus sp.]